MPPWVTISSLATAGGTLVLAVATFASVRSANRAARVAEESLLSGIRPLLVPSRLEDAPLKATFADSYLAVTPGGGGTAHVADTAIYLTLSLRNAGAGIAVLHGWRFEPATNLGDVGRPDIDKFRRLSRDLFIAAGDVGFWQGAVRDRTDWEWEPLTERISARQRIQIDLLYGDYQGGQRMISRFALIPRPRNESGWLGVVGRHWNVDRPDPR